MSKQKGFTLIELLILIAILGVIAAVVALNAGGFFGCGAGNETTSDSTVINETQFEDLRSQPIGSLNVTELQSVVDYYCHHYSRDWAMVYQNQIIIKELERGLE